MDPCPFVRIIIGSLSLKSPTSLKPAFSGVNPSCYCKIKLKNFPTQYTTIPISFDDNNATQQLDDQIQACFNFKKPEFDKFSEKSSGNNCLKIEVYSDRTGNHRVCGFGSGKVLGSVEVGLDVKGAENRGFVIRNGWVGIGDRSAKGSKLFLNVRAEPDPRFVFEFDGEPECSPQVLQVNGDVFTGIFLFGGFVFCFVFCFFFPLCLCLIFFVFVFMVLIYSILLHYIFTF